jgi:hypothetical protein
MRTRVVSQRIEVEFDAHKFNIHSQCGEDGLIEFFIKKMKVELGYFVEFGAWDGRHLSNCANLADKGWSGCFIEGSPERYKDLLLTYDNNEKINPVNCFVSPDGDNSLDVILTKVKTPRLIDVLSIDIDGYDYLVWESLREYDVRLVVIEFNPTIPSNVVVVQEELGDKCFGNSLAALWELGATKGYSLVATTGWNAFFVRVEDCKVFGIKTYKPWEIKESLYETYFFHGYNGQVKLAGHGGLLWHGVPFNEEKFQVLPKSLQKLPVGQDEGYFVALQRLKAGL